MPAFDLTGAVWRASSRSGMYGNCVQTALFRAHVAVRDSKDPAGPALVCDHPAWAAFVASGKAGDFDRP